MPENLRKLSRVPCMKVSAPHIMFMFIQRGKNLPHITAGFVHVIRPFHDKGFSIVCALHVSAMQNRFDLSVFVRSCHRPFRCTSVNPCSHVVALHIVNLFHFGIVHQKGHVVGNVNWRLNAKAFRSLVTDQNLCNFVYGICLVSSFINASPI